MVTLATTHSGTVATTDDGVTISGLAANKLPKALSATKLGSSGFSEVQTTSPPVAASLVDSAGVSKAGPGFLVSKAATGGNLGLAVTPSGGGANQSYLELDSYGSYSEIVSVATGGTAASPTALSSAASLFSVLVNGQYDTTPGHVAIGASLSFTAAEDWTVSTRGSEAILSTCAIGSNTLNNRILIDGDGNTNVENGFLIIETSTPASAAAAGVAGSIAWDAGFVYVCVATNTWKRVAIATW